jgi:hypothetical protein
MAGGAMAGGAMAGGGFVAAAAGAASPVGVTMDSRGCAAARVEGAASERHRPSCREENASVRTNAPTATAHKSIRLFTGASMKKS